MSGNVFSIFWPSEVWLNLVIVFIWGLAIVVLYKGISIYKNTIDNIKLLEMSTNVEKLADTLMKKNIDHEEQFAEFKKNILAEPGIKNNEDIFDHIHTIYEAGPCVLA